jgi:hypothetical protein
VQTWRRYRLAEALHIEARFHALHAVSRDRRRLLISTQNCPFDCPPELRGKYYELQFP